MARVEVEDEVKECLPLKILEAFDSARNNFLSQINKLCKAKINLPPAKGSSLIHSKFIALPMKKASLKMWSTSIKVCVDVKNILEKFKEQGIVNKK